MQIELKYSAKHEAFQGLIATFCNSSVVYCLLYQLGIAYRAYGEDEQLI